MSQDNILLEKFSGERVPIVSSSQHRHGTLYEECLTSPSCSVEKTNKGLLCFSPLTIRAHQHRLQVLPVAEEISKSHWFVLVQMLRWVVMQASAQGFTSERGDWHPSTRNTGGHTFDHVVSDPNVCFNGKTVSG